MMRPVLLRSFAILAMFAFAIGCSSDSGTDVTLKQGNPNDPTYLAVRSTVVPALDSLIERNFQHLTNPYGFPLDIKTDWRDLLPGLPDDSVEYDYNAETGWYSIYVGNFATSVNSVIIDSVRFKIDDIPSSHLNNRVDQIESILHIDKTYDGQESSYNEEQYYCSSVFENVNTTTVTVEIEGTLTVDEYQSNGGVLTHENFDFVITVSSLEFEREPTAGGWTSGTLAGGSVGVQVEYTVDMTEGTSTTSENSNWTINASFDSNGDATIDAISDNTLWSFTESF